MKPRIQINEIVTIVSQPDRIQKPIVGLEGIVVGMADVAANEAHIYGVHINYFGLTFAIPERAMVTTGRTATPTDIVVRKARSKWPRRA